MTTITSKSHWGVAQIAHWAGRLLGLAGVLTFIAFAIGEGLPPANAMNLSFVALDVMLVGFALIWWNDLVGGVMSLVGITLFEVLEISANGHPAGGIFYLLLIPGAVSILAWFLRNK